ncbi:MAG: shikimate kinase [Gemmatimonadales bacterium]|nr:shikimate kinase [Gemmatimonadales bacterium]MBA3553211.1 shikimate kinase [Gemmatimonadales bacterium]
MPRHLVLVGLPGAGKSTVGRLAAEALGAPLIDVDLLLARETGMPVAQIFGMAGEVKFRQMERDAVKTARAREPCVIVPGGGWAAQPGEITEARSDSLLIYLKCPPEVALTRTEQGEVRPLLAGGDPVKQMRSLLEEREPYYQLADYVVEARTRPPEAVAGEVVGLARRWGGWDESLRSRV